MGEGVLHGEDAECEGEDQADGCCAGADEVRGWCVGFEEGVVVGLVFPDGGCVGGVVLGANCVVALSRLKCWWSEDGFPAILFDIRLHGCVEARSVLDDRSED